MTDREAAKQALEAYDKHEPLAVVMEELRTALEQPDRQTLQAAGTHPAPCARHCEAKAFELEIRSLKSALRAALEQQAEPVQYEMRMRPTWEANSWSDWQKCSKESAGDYIKTPKLHDWLYEVRAIYTQPPQRKPLTINEVEQILAQHNYEIHGDRARYIVRMTEEAHGIGEKP